MIKESYNKQIVEYLRKNLKKGYAKDQLKWALINQGYTKLEVEKGLKVVDKEFSQPAPQTKKEEPKPEFNINTMSVEPEPKSFWKRFFSG